MTEMRAHLTVTADATRVVTENRNAAQSMRELRNEATATAASMNEAGREMDRQADMAARLDRTFDNFGRNRRSASSSAAVFEGDRELRAFQQEQTDRSARAYKALEESMNPVIRAQREFTTAQGALRDAVVTGAATNTDAARTLEQLTERFDAFVQSQSSAFQSAQAITRALDAEENAIRSLVLSFDPVTRAKMELTDQERLLGQAILRGTAINTDAATALDHLRARHDAFVQSQSAAFQSAQAITQAIDQEEQAIRALTLSLDPALQKQAAFAAQRDLIAGGVTRGTINSDEGTRLTNAVYDRTFGAIDAEQVQAAQRLEQAYRSLQSSLDPVIRAQREFDAAQDIVRQSLAAGTIGVDEAARSIQQLKARLDEVVRANSAAAQSAQVFERAIEEDTQAVRALMLSLDPVAQKQAEMARGEALITRAVRQGIITKDEAARASLQLAAAQDQVVRGASRMGMGVQNVSFQLTDFIVQVQSGQSAAIAFAQQAPQLLGGFGALGAALGLVAAMSGPFIGMMLSGGDAAGSLDDRLSALDGSLQSVEARLGILRDIRLDETFGSMTGNVRTLTGMLLELDRAAELRNLKNSLDATLRENIDPSLMQQAWAGFKAGINAPIMSGDRSRAITRQLTEENFAELTGGRGLSLDEFTARRNELTTLAESGDIESVARRVIDLFSDMKENEPFSTLNTDLQDLLSTLGEFVVSTAQTEAVLNGTAEKARLDSGAEDRLRVDGQRLELARTMLIYGNDSRETEAARAEIARENYRIEVEREGYTGAALDRLMQSYDQTVSAETAAANWADRMADVRSEVEGILSALGSIGGEALDRAAKQAELTALNAGSTVADAARAGRTARREAEYDARTAGAGFFGRVGAGIQRRWDEAGDQLDDEVSSARSEAREREREAKKKPKSGAAAERSALTSASEIKRELARIQPSYDADVAAAEAWRDKALASLDKTRAGYAEFAGDVETIYRERMKNAYEDDLKRREDWAAGVERGLIGAEDSLVTWADTAEGLMTDWGKKGEDAFISLAKTGKVQMEDLVDYVVDQFARMAFQQTVQAGLNSVLGMAVNGLGSWVGGQFGGAAPATSPRPAARPASLRTNHTGSPGVIRSYAFGGEGDSLRQDEQLTMMRRGEEILTSRALENAGALISAMTALAARPAQGGGGEAMPLIINPVNNSGVPLKVEAVEGPPNARGQRQVEFVMSDVVSGAMKKPGGAARKTMASYGVVPPGIAR